MDRLPEGCRLVRVALERASAGDLHTARVALHGIEDLVNAVALETEIGWLERRKGEAA
jgi:hypothetical protein